MLVGRISDTSNYVGTTSNIFINNISYTSNYVGTTSNILASLISDTSNYMQRTSNILVETIKNNISNNKWINSISNNIYFNTSNVGIGTYNPTSKLHLYDNINLKTEAIIQNNFDIVNEIKVTGATSTIIGTNARCISFPYSGSATTKDYNFVTTVPLMCDILIVGGGGGGGDPHGGGGGAGQLVLIYQTILDGNYTIKVGAGGIGGTGNGGVVGAASTPPTKGSNSEFGSQYRNVIAEGGGANNKVATDKNGGSGAGGDGYTYGGGSGSWGGGTANTTTDSWPGTLFVFSRGNNGGGQVDEGSTQIGGGGGGAGEAGYSASSSIPGKGGDGLSGIAYMGIDFQTIFGNYGSLESDGKYYFAGGGGGGNTTVFNGSKGGGGAGGIGGTFPANVGANAVPNTGSGGGACGGDESSRGGSGSAGIVIIKYSLPSSQLVYMSSIELVNGTRTDSNVDYSIGNYNGIFKIISSINNSSQTERLVINNTGNVGLGITDPKYPLHVGSIAISSTIDRYILNGNNIWAQTLNLFNPMQVSASAKFNGNIWVNECYINSDIRIKEDIQDINDDSALQKILLIEPKTYKYIDKVEKGYKKEYGFVAQQIQKVLPDAVILEKSYIPNIMLIASYNKKIITLPHKPINVILKLKDKIKCIDSNNICIEIEVYKIINELTFEIKDLDKEFANNKIFVYGTHVDDFQILSKNHIFTLNVGATQELYRQIKEQEDIINSQEERMNILEKTNAILNQKFENLLLEIDLINKQFY